MLLWQDIPTKVPLGNRGVILIYNFRSIISVPSDKNSKQPITSDLQPRAEHVRFLGLSVLSMLTQLQMPGLRYGIAHSCLSLFPSARSIQFPLKPHPRWSQTVPIWCSELTIPFMVIFISYYFNRCQCLSLQSWGHRRALRGRWSWEKWSKQARNCGDRRKAGQSSLHPPSQSQVEIVHRECSQQPQFGEWKQPFLFSYHGLPERFFLCQHCLVFEWSMFPALWVFVRILVLRQFQLLISSDEASAFHSIVHLTLFSCTWTPVTIACPIVCETKSSPSFSVPRYQFTDCKVPPGAHVSAWLMNLWCSSGFKDCVGSSRPQGLRQLDFERETVLTSEEELG